MSNKDTHNKTKMQVAGTCTQKERRHPLSDSFDMDTGRDTESG